MTDVVKRAREVLLALTLTAGCSDRAPAPRPSARTAPSATVASTVPAAPLRIRAGSAIALSQSEATLWVAEEDRKALWRIGLPLAGEGAPERIDLPGPPAQVLPLHDSVIVTIRQPSMLLALDTDGTELGRLPLAADAWGIAVTADAQTAVVTSAWSHQVAIVDLGTLTLRGSIAVAREPRGVVIPSGAGSPAYVTHLVGTELTRIDGIAVGAPSARRVALPPAPSRNPDPSRANASLAYGAALSPDERRLFVPRQALGVVAQWYGAATVDVLSIPEDTPLAPPRSGAKASTVADFMPATLDKNKRGALYAPTREVDRAGGPVPFLKRNAFYQPRAIVYRTTTDTLLVASEGSDELVELDAGFVEPALGGVTARATGSGYGERLVVATRGGAPSGIALSRDEETAFVFCRSTSDVVALSLAADSTEAPVVVRLGVAPLLESVAELDPERADRERAALGSKLFYTARDERLSDGAYPSAGIACSGCHPDGRDDGHVWLEVTATRRHGPLPRLIDGPTLLDDLRARVDTVGPSYAPTFSALGRARQTPMLAGRVASPGPFGWRGESDTLEARIQHGARLHRWGATPHAQQFTKPSDHARALAAFLRVGLRPPARQAAAAAQVARGRALFESDEVGCSACHIAERSPRLADGGVPARSGYADESGVAFRTPPLAFVGGTPPYFHDGSVNSLDALVAQNHDRMGRTTHLSGEDRAALVAYLRTL